MTEDINFITAIDLKDYLPINYNVDDHRLIMAIDDAEALNIKRILGKKLYVKLKEIIANNEINTNHSYVEYKTLLDEYIFKCVIRYALVEALPWTTFKIENKTTGTTGGENVTPAEISQLSYLIGTVKAKADYHAQE